MRSRLSTIMQGGLALGLVLALTTSARAAWVLNGAAVCTAANNQEHADMTDDGAGGVIMTWDDARYGVSDTDIYAQRLNASGTALWFTNGVSICASAGEQSEPRLVSDGSGGVIVTWYDYRAGNADIYAQRLNASGIPLWTANGVAVCTAGGDQFLPQLASDGSGGAILTWEDGRYGFLDHDIFAQRLNAAGAPQWSANGVFVCGAATSQASPKIMSDGSGGAFVVWEDARNGASDIYAQRINFFGNAQWTANGVPVCAAGGSQYFPKLVTDGSGGAIFTWSDWRSGDEDVYAQRLNGNGFPMWTTDGVAVCAVSGDQDKGQLIADGSGGAILTWDDGRSVDMDIYAQRLNSSGAPQWAAYGVAVCALSSDQVNPRLMGDGSGGAIIAWNDYRAYDVYAQRIDAYGIPQWAASGVAVSTAAGGQAVLAMSGGSGSVCMALIDNRSGQEDMYAQRIETRYGECGIPEPKIASVVDNPGYQGGVVALDWDASQRDELNQRLIAYYSIWRAVTFAAASEQRASSAPPASALASRNVAADFQGPGIYVENTSSGTYYWEWVGNQSARYTPGYSMLVETRQDSIASEPAVHYFQVLAHTYDQFTFWESNVATGYSVDNLAPAAPSTASSQRNGADVQLIWRRAAGPDVRDYAIYRATSSGVTPVPMNFLATSDDTFFVDQGAPTSALYYIVTAYDVHGNQSVASNEFAVAALTDVGNTPALTALTVLQNHPNPFNGTTDFEIGLPSDGDVRIEVFDVAGRRVSAIDSKGIKGWQRIPFAGRDERERPLAGGVYFYRVSASGTSVTRKMVIAR